MADLYIGLMSGTSMDGIDAALVDLSLPRPQIIATHSHDYPADLHRQLEAALQLDDPLHTDLSALDRRVGECFAAAAQTLLTTSGTAAGTVTAIGSHGQTIRHEPGATPPYSLQIGNAGIIAAHTGIDVIADFRRADIEAGGQGAPLVPAFHKAVFASSTENRVALNIGGIANITTLPADASRAVTGFDTGPGNTLMDYWTQLHLQSAMDMDGEWAAGGEVDELLLAKLLADPYFTLPPPKSTGREYFNAGWLQQYLSGSNTSPQTVQATLCELTARSIAAAINADATGTQRLIVCGGGTHNASLMQRLQANLPGLSVESSQLHGVDPDWVEAIAFAWLAKQRLDNKAGNIPEVTGARGPVLLGTLFSH